MLQAATFDFSQVNLHWFPSHMARGLQAMQRKLERADVIVEVRDARIPFSSANPILEGLSHDKVKRIVVFNKTDLSDQQSNNRLERYLKANSKVSFISMDSTNRRSMTRLLEMIKGHCLPEAKLKEDRKFRLLIAGIPNVGKSTLINRLRSIGTDIGGKAVRTGGVAGVTRSVSESVRISPFPRLYMFDSPGVLMPKLQDPEVALKIALTGGIVDKIAVNYILAEYLLYILNRRPGGYMRHFGLKAPITGFETMLPIIAEKQAQFCHGKINQLNAISTFLKLFRNGQLGRFTLDTIPD